MSFAKHLGLQPCASTRQTVRLSGKSLRCSRGLAFPYFTGGIKKPANQKTQQAKPGFSSGGGRHGSCCVLRCAAQICEINICAESFSLDDAARFAVYRNRQLFSTRLVTVRDVRDVLSRGFATSGKFIAVAYRHSHEVSF